MKTQVDYLKFKVEKVNCFDRTSVIEHPTIKERYHLKPDIIFRGKVLHGEYIDIYYNEKNKFINISASLPYLVYGHNYVDFIDKDAAEILTFLSQLFNVNISKAKLQEYEIAYIHNSIEPISNVLKNIIRLDRMYLQKSEQKLSIYGTGNCQFKIYDVKYNLKRKVNKELFKSIEFENENCIKTEFKLIRIKNMTIEAFIGQEMNKALEFLSDFICTSIIYAPITNIKVGEKFDDILFYTLQKIGFSQTIDVNHLISNTIDELDISYSKKTARRNALTKKIKGICDVPMHKKFHETLNFERVFFDESGQGF